MNRFAASLVILFLLFGIMVGYGLGFWQGHSEMKVLYDVNVEAMRLRDKQLEGRLRDPIVMPPEVMQ